MPTQSERRAEAERRLLHAAATLIAEGGPSAMTLAAVGERAGYSRGLVTHHFGSKAVLMDRLVDSVTLSFREAVYARAGAEMGLPRMLALVDTYLETVADATPEHRARLVLWADALARDSADVRPAMRQADREFRDEIAEGVRQALAAGEVPADVDPEGTAVVVVALLRGVASAYLLDPEHVDLQAAAHEIRALVSARGAGR